jgi:ABC-type multidrug transport system fused ATPase/permease subunit
VEVLRQRVSELQRDATTAAHVSAGIAKPISLAPSEDSAKLKEAQHALENLAEENRQLSTRITDLEAMRVASMKSATESEVQEQEGALEKILHGPVRSEARTWNQWQWLMFGSILLLAFAAGGYMVDWESRRRHGGFRI